MRKESHTRSKVVLMFATVLLMTVNIASAAMTLSKPAVFRLRSSFKLDDIAGYKYYES